MACALVVSIGLLYGAYIRNPIFFDDIYFFIAPDSYFHWSSDRWLDRRWITTETLELTYRLWNLEVPAYRIGSLVIHILTSVSLMLFVRDLLRHSGCARPEVPALAAALLFGLHPVTAFAAGYLIERSILLASLFSVWMWIAVHRGVSGNHRGWLLLSVLCYYLAVFSKEHAITALPVALLVAWNAAGGDLRRTLAALAQALPLWAITAVLIILSSMGTVGHAYEPIVLEMLQGTEDPNTAGFYLRSAVNQGALFFKYILFWLLPNENWMAIDLRQPFPATWSAWPWIGGAIAFLVYPFMVVFLMWRAQLTRLVGIAMLSPWLLFLTMFGGVQYQESFVLYRSYLWALPAALLPGILFARWQPRSQYVALAILGLFLFGLTWSRLQTFSHPLLVWEEAQERLNGRDDLPGTYRIYHNRGLEYLRFGETQKALADFDRVIALNPSFPYVYNERGAAHVARHEYDLALEDFNRIIAAKPDYPRPYVGRGSALIKLGRRAEGLADLEHACRLGTGCAAYRKELTK